MTNRDKPVRLHTTVLAAADYGVNVMVLFAFAAIGTISYTVPITILGIAIVLNVVFISAITTQYSKRFADPSMTFAQVWAALSINIFALVIAPQIAYVFIINLFVPLAYASLNFQARGFFITWLALSTLICAAFLATDAGTMLALSRPQEQVLFLIVFTLALARHVAINGQISRLRERLRVKNLELHDMTVRLSELATRDELTGLWNRRYVFECLETETQRAERAGTRFCVAVLDVDHFKAVNDTYGHGIGDEVLRRLSAIFGAHIRGSDRVARYGGEEFVILFVDADVIEAETALERVRKMVESHDWEQIAAGLRVTVSVGFAAWHSAKPVATILSQADRALYLAKNGGRNRVVFAEESISPKSVAVIPT
ncbi:MAG TPA: GGDEF domain-containing protein [Noviherbaspirillum sp.]|nr:GGDEF domain-containing protein [Noviherbaspirillum sp.]